MKAEFARFCPQCGSPSVEFGALIGAQSKCKVCSWEGPKEELLHMPFSHDMGNAEQMLQMFANDIRRVYAESALSFGRVLFKWGFMPDKKELQSKVLQLYLTEVARASLAAIIKVRAELEKEYERAGRPRSSRRQGARLLPQGPVACLRR